MVNDTLLTLNLAGGFSVLLGYSFIILTPVGSKLYRVFTKNERTVFLFLVLLSIISFSYLVYWASFSDSLKDWKLNLYIASLAIYLFGASIWSPVVYRVATYRKNYKSELIPLSIAGLGAVGMLVAIASSIEIEGIEYSVAMIASIILVIQHFIFDLMYWFTIHNKRKSSYR